MRRTYTKTDISTKTVLVQEYLRLNAETGMKIKKFTSMKNIAYSTFRKWLAQYLATERNTACVSLPVVSPDNGFIIISEETIHPVDVQTGVPDKVTLRYKGTVLEFDNSQMEQVMEILKRW